MCAFRGISRLRGGKSTVLIILSRSGGSSPLARGRDCHSCQAFPELGVIPARAGERYRDSTACRQAKGHPRSRGGESKQRLIFRAFFSQVVSNFFTLSCCRRADCSFRAAFREFLPILYVPEKLGKNNSTTDVFLESRCAERGAIPLSQGRRQYTEYAGLLCRGYPRSHGEK